jgi:hypothetical protein
MFLISDDFEQIQNLLRIVLKENQEIVSNFFICNLLTGNLRSRR